MQELKPRRRIDNHPLLGEQPSLALMRANVEGRMTRTAAADGGERYRSPAGAESLPWWNPFAHPSGPALSIPQRLEPKTFLASERTFMSWLHMAITLSSIAAALLAFAATSRKNKDPMHRLSRNLVEFIALVLLPLAIFIVAYATVVFLWRNSQIALKQAAYIDDRRGPLLLAGLVVSALTAIFMVSAVDLFDQIKHGGISPPSPSPLPSPPSPAMPLSMGPTNILAPRILSNS